MRLLKHKGVQSPIESIYIEEEPRESRKKFQTLFNLMPDPVVIVDGKGKFLAVNDRMEEVTGFSKQELLGKNFPRTKIVAAKSKALLTKNLVKVMVGKHVAPYEVDLVTKDGKKLTVDINAAKIGYEGKLASFVIFRDITERKKAKETLKGSENYLKTMLDSIFSGVVVVDEKTHEIVDANPKALETIGASRERVIGKVCHSFICPAEKGKCPISDLGQTVDKSERVLLRANGERIPILKTVTTTMWRGHKYLIESIIDITDRKRMEETLRESEEKYRKQFDEALDAIFLGDAETGIIIDCNRAACELVGRKKSELVGKHQRILHPPEKIEGGFSRTFKMHLKGKEGQILETQIITKKGEIRDVAIKANLFELGDKKLIQGMFRDITESKRVGEELAHERDLLHALMDNIPDTIYFKDAASRFTRINKAQAKVLGLNGPEEAVGKTDSDFFTEEHARDAYADEQEIMEKGQPLINKVEKTERPDRYFLWTSTTKVPIKDKEGQVIGIVGMSRDITERKQMQEKLQEYSEHLEELVKKRTRQLKKAQEQLLKAERLAAIGETAAMVGHDLRNPLQVIVSTVYLAKKLLKDSLPPGKKFAGKHDIGELLVTVEEQLQYMDKIVSDVQDYARPLKPELVETSLHQLINDTLLTITVPETVEVSIMIPEDFPKLMVDPTLMKRVFTNLFKNALQAMPDGGQLTIRPSKTEETAFISVQDTGVGIPEENLHKLFQPLFTTKSKGSGFGLAACKRLVEAHNGSITFESKVGRGSTFTVKIPLRKEVS